MSPPTPEESQVVTADAGRAVWYDPELLRQRFLSLLAEYVAWLRTEKVRAAVGRNALVQLRAQESKIQARLHNTFSLVVLGEFKRGKSTLINALLGMPVVTTNIAPETVTINIIRHGPELRAEAYLKDGGRIQIGLDELTAERLVPLLANAQGTKSTPQRDPSAQLNAARLRKLLVDYFNESELRTLCFDLEVNYESLLGDTIGDKARELILYLRRRDLIQRLLNLCKELRPQISIQNLYEETLPAPLTRSPDAILPLSKRLAGLEQLQHKIGYLVIDVPVDWLQGIDLVDTPGTGDLLWRFDEQVRTYLHKADAVIYVISALSPLSESEETFLKKSILPRDFPKLLFVVNSMDVPRTQQEAQRVLADIKAKVQHFFPDAPVFGLSALDEICRQYTEPRPQPARADQLAASFGQFRAALQESILFNRDLIHLDRGVADAEQMVNEFEAHIQRLRRALDSNQGQLSAAIAQCEDQNSALHQQIEQYKQQARQQINELCEQACTWMDAFLDRIRNAAIPGLAHASLEDVQRHFPFFLADSLHLAMNHCLDAQQPHILAVLTNVKVAIQQDIQRLTDNLIEEQEVEQLVAKTTLNASNAWTNLDTFNFFVDFGLTSIFNVANELLISAAGLLMQHHKLTAQQRLVRYQEKLLESLPKLQESVTVELRSLYHDMANEVEQQIDGLYRQEIEASVATLRQAQELHSAGESQVAGVGETFQDILTISGEMRYDLQSFREQLWLHSAAQ